MGGDMAILYGHGRYLQVREPDHLQACDWISALRLSRCTVVLAQTLLRSIDRTVSIARTNNVNISNFKRLTF
jgi:hypothetical protein